MIGDHGDRGDHGDGGSEHREVMTRPGALLEEFGVAWHQVSKEALGLLGEALPARGWCRTLRAAPFWPLALRTAPAPPQPDLAHCALEQLLRVVVQCSRRLDVLAAQCPCQVAAFCGKRGFRLPQGCTESGARVPLVRLVCSGKGLGRVREQGRDRVEGGLGERGLGEEVRGSEEKGFSGP